MGYTEIGYKKGGKMTEKFIYEIQAFAYSNFEHHILLHEKEFSAIEFRKMIEIARQKAKNLHEKDDDFYYRYNYPENVIAIMIKEFGFVKSEHLTAHVGCDFNDVCDVELEE